jgi:hypothetical protein
VEVVASLPLLLLAALVAAQLTAAGYALWSAGLAARAGARAAHVGGDSAAAARRALPGVLRTGSRVSGNGPVRVRVLVPRLVPGLPRLPLTAATALDPAADG